MNTLLSAVDTVALKHAANLAWQGMLAIFVVMFLIYLAIVALNFFTNKERVKAAVAKLKEKTSKKKPSATPAVLPSTDAAANDEASEPSDQNNND